MRLVEKLLILLKTAHEEERTLYARLDENERSTASNLEQWSAKDALAHILLPRCNMCQRVFGTMVSQRRVGTYYILEGVYGKQYYGYSPP